MRVAFALTAALATAAAAEPRVSLQVLGDEEQAQAFTASLRELLSRLDVTLEPGEGPTLAAVEADFTTPRACALTVVDARGVTVLTRRFDEVRSSALLAEAAAHVVQSVVDDLLHAGEPRRPAQSPPTEAPRVEAERPASEPAEGPGPLEVGAFVAGRELGIASVGGGAAVALTMDLGRFHPGLLVLLGYQAPIEVPQGFLTLSVQTLSPRALLSLDVLRLGRFRFDAALGGGPDVFLISTQGPALPMPGPHPPAFTSPVLTALLRANFALASRVNLYLGATLDADLRPPNFVERQNMENVPVLTPWRFRPSLMLGFSFSPLGGTP